jgi:hypothetical protein
MSRAQRRTTITIRIYDYLLGGKDNFEADRQAAAAAIAGNPHLATAATTLT